MKGLSEAVSISYLLAPEPVSCIQLYSQKQFGSGEKGISEAVQRFLCCGALSETPQKSLQAGQWTVALEILGSMPGLRVLPDAVTLASAISCLEKGEQWERALQLLSQGAFRGARGDR